MASFESNWLRWSIFLWRLERLSDEVFDKIDRCENVEVLRLLGKHNHHLTWCEANWNFVEPSENNDPESDKDSLDRLIDYMADIEAETRELLAM